MTGWEEDIAYFAWGILFVFIVVVGTIVRLLFGRVKG